METKKGMLEKPASLTQYLFRTQIILSMSPLKLQLPLGLWLTLPPGSLSCQRRKLDGILDLL